MNRSNEENVLVMKNNILLLMLLLPAVMAFSQNEKNIVFDANAQVRKISAFRKVEVSGAIDLFLSQGNEEAVAVSAADDDVLQKIRTEVRDNVLFIYLDTRGFSWKGWTNNKVKAYVTLKNLNHIEGSGACNIKTTGKLKLSDLKIELSGASDFTGDVAVSNMDISLNGASECKLSGTAINANINCTGASSFKAYEFETDYCKVGVSGAASVRVTINKELKARASGASSISYKGEGLITDISSSGASSVKHLKTD